MAATKQSNAQDVIRLMNEPDKIRNISVIAHVDHGKTTLVDSLLAKAGVINADDAGTKNYMMVDPEEQARGITIKSTGISLVCPHGESGDQYLINLVDSPGHVDFSSEVTAALRITDGALLVVDCVEGTGVQTETVTRQALAEKIKPCLHVNKVDRGILELQLDAEGLYRNLCRVIESVNHIMYSYNLDTEMDPLLGNVSFGSGKQGWAFTLPQFAKILAKKSNKDPKDLLKRLWGDHFYDPETKKFTNVPKSASGKPLKRFFCQMVMEPIIDIFKTIMSDDLSTLPKKLDALGITIPSSKQDLRGQDLLKFVMQKFLPAADALVDMVVTHLPSPKVAQKYRVETLYTGPMDDECANAIRNCDPNGPMVMYISKMVSVDGKRFTCYGRVFSGTLRTGMKVNVLAPEYSGPGSKENIFFGKSVQRVTVMMGKTTETTEFCRCGNTIGVIGLDQYLLKSGTISDSPTCHSIQPMKFSVSPVVQVAVEPKNPKDLPKFVEALKVLVKPDPLIQTSISPSGEHIIAGAGELHLEVVMKNLKILLKDMELTVGQPVVGFRETVTSKSSQVVLSKSQNGHNRIFMTAEPMEDGLVKMIEEKKINVNVNMNNQEAINERSAILVKEFNWDSTQSKKIWFFAPEETHTNVFVNCTSGISYLDETREHVLQGFNWAMKEGVLCDEEVRGARFNLVDCTLHADAVHRGAGQLIPCSKRAISGALLVSSPRLMEPIFNVEIQTTQDVIGSIHSVIGKKRGYVLSEELKQGTPLYIVKAYLPVAESFGFTSAIREATSGKAFPQAVFSHYQVIEDDPFVTSSFSHKLVMDIRKRKGLQPNLPTIEKFHDKLN